MSLYNLSTYINSVTQNTLSIDDPVIYDGSNIYQSDLSGVPINTNYVYDSSRNIISDLQS